MFSIGQIKKPSTPEKREAVRLQRNSDQKTTVLYPLNQALPRGHMEAEFSLTKILIYSLLVLLLWLAYITATVLSLHNTMI